MMKPRLALALVFAAALYAPLPALAYTAEEEKAIADVEKHLSGLSTIVADFTQIAPDGSLTSGKFYLQRPGKMRWQYDPPTPILMLANGDFLTFYDYELDQRSDIPLEDTLAGFLARKSIAFGKEVTVTDVVHGNGSLRLTITQESKPDAGKLTLEFSTGPLQLHNMKVVDVAGQQTSISLANQRYGIPLDDELFKLENRFKPEIGKPSSKSTKR